MFNAFHVSRCEGFSESWNDISGCPSIVNADNSGSAMGMATGIARLTAEL